MKGVCANNTHIYVARRSNNRVILSGYSIVACYHSVKLCALAARAFERNKMVLCPGCEGRAKCSLYRKSMRSVRFIVKTRGCCCNLPLALCWMCNSPRTGCAWRVAPTYM